MGAGLKARSVVGVWLPFCHQPINRSTIQKPGLVSKPRFSVSAICHISPNACAGTCVFSKKETARSPVMTPRLSVSARLKRCEYAAFSAGESWRRGWSVDVVRYLTFEFHHHGWRVPKSLLSDILCYRITLPQATCAQAGLIRCKHGARKE